MSQGVAPDLARAPVVHLIVGMWLSWSTTLIAIKIGLRSADPLTFSLVRVVLTTLVLGVFIVLAGHGSGERTMRTLPLHLVLLALGLTGVGGFMLLQTFGLRDAPVGAASVVLFSQPLVVAVLSRVLFTERLFLRKVAGLVIGWLGVAFVIGVEVGSIGTSPLALALVFGAALGWSTQTLIYKAVPALPNIIHVLFWTHLYSLGLLAAIVPFVGWRFEVSAVSITAVVWAALAGGVGGMGLMFRVLQRRPAGEASSYLFAVPIIAAGLGVVLLGEPAHIGLAVGSLAVGASIWLISRGRATPHAVMLPVPPP